jgi:hypothetical protein
MLTSLCSVLRGPFDGIDDEHRHHRLLRHGKKGDVGKLSMGVTAKLVTSVRRE